MDHSSFKVTREKHLDHLVRVVPLIVLGYGIQCYIFMQMKGPFSSTTCLILGAMLIFMICSFVFYDVNHQITLNEDHLEFRFLTLKKVISYQDIVSIEITDPTETFGTVMIRAKHGKFRLYFVDDIDKIKQWIENRKESLPLAA